MFNYLNNFVDTQIIITIRARYGQLNASEVLSRYRMNCLPCVMFLFNGLSGVLLQVI